MSLLQFFSVQGIYECKWKCVTPNNIRLYNAHTENGEKGKCSILSTKIDYIYYNRKALPKNPTEGRYQKGYEQMKGESRTCQ